jgi:CRISPR-associated endonuclease/helicase Cas3
MQGFPDYYWAKFSLGDGSHQAGAEVSHLALLDHSIDVGTTLEVLLANGYEFPLARAAGLEKLSTPQLHRVLFLAFIHDLGKAAVDFQRQIFSDENRNRRHKGHTALCTFFLTAAANDPASLAFRAFLPGDFDQWFTHEDDDGGDVSFARMLLASWGHHGRPIDFDLVAPSSVYSDVQWDDWRYADFKRLLQELLDFTAHRWPGILQPADPISVNSAFMEEFNGILQLADWVASDSRQFTYDLGDFYASRADFALDASKEFLKKTGRIALSADKSFSEVFGFQPNAMQQDFLGAVSEFIQ